MQRIIKKKPPIVSARLLMPKIDNPTNSKSPTTIPPVTAAPLRNPRVADLDTTNATLALGIVAKASMIKKKHESGDKTHILLEAHAYQTHTILAF